MVSDSQIWPSEPDTEVPEGGYAELRLFSTSEYNIQALRKRGINTVWNGSILTFIRLMHPGHQALASMMLRTVTVDAVKDGSIDNKGFNLVADRLHKIVETVLADTPMDSVTPDKQPIKKKSTVKMEPQLTNVLPTFATSDHYPTVWNAIKNAQAGDVLSDLEEIHMAGNYLILNAMEHVIWAVLIDEQVLRFVVFIDPDYKADTLIPKTHAVRLTLQFESYNGALTNNILVANVACTGEAAMLVAYSAYTGTLNNCLSSESPIMLLDSVKKILLNYDS